MSVELIKEYVGAISPLLSSIVVVAGFYSTKKMLKSEVDVMLTKFEASTETKARESASKVVSDTGNTYPGVCYWYNGENKNIPFDWIPDSE